MTHTLNNLRLVKAQVASKQHECVECVEPIEEGERYMRAALPPNVEAFPDQSVFQEDAWQFVDHTWTIEKTHELCYSKRYFRPVAQSNESETASCGHRRYSGSGSCGEITCLNYAGRHWQARGGLFSE
jgi:hypothetical protein